MNILYSVPFLCTQWSFTVNLFSNVLFVPNIRLLLKRRTYYVFDLLCLLYFTPLLFTFLLSECKINNRKTIISLKRGKYQPRTKKRSFLNKTKSHHFSFTTCFIICKFIIYKSKPKEGIHVSSLTEYKFNGLEFLEFQNILWTYCIIRFTPCQKWKLKIMTHFLTLHCCYLVTFN